jgi:hypothetical protein
MLANSSNLVKLLEESIGEEKSTKLCWKAGL